MRTDNKNQSGTTLVSLNNVETIPFLGDSTRTRRNEDELYNARPLKKLTDAIGAGKDACTLLETIYESVKGVDGYYVIEYSGNDPRECDFNPKGLEQVFTQTRTEPDATFTGDQDAVFTSNAFTIPSDGLYDLRVTPSISAKDADRVYFYAKKNGTPITLGIQNFTATDQIEIRLHIQGNTGTVYIDSFQASIVRVADYSLFI